MRNVSQKLGTGLVTVLFALSTGAASAQDFFMPGTSPMDLAPQSQALTSSVIGNMSIGNAARSAPRGARSGTRIAPRAFAPGRVSDARMGFPTTPASRKQAIDAYIARIQRSNPKAAAAIGGELRRRNPERELAAVIGPYGLRTNDAADVMTAFLIAGWEIMTGGDANASQVQGVRRQVAGQLVASGAIADPAVRTRFAEELKITTFVLVAGAGSAARDGDLAEYRRGVAQFYGAQTGENIGSWRLTPTGFAR